MNLMLALFLLVTTSFGYAPSNAGTDNLLGDGFDPTDPWDNAKMFQWTFDKHILDKNPNSMYLLFTKNFYYTGCDGRKYGWQKYVDMAFAAPSPRRVVAARADKNYVIYKIEYLGKEEEIMIFGKLGYWKAERAQGLIC